MADYTLLGPKWETTIVTWSFASSNLAGQLGGSFSNFFSSGSLFAQDISTAFSRWSQVSNLKFVQVADASNVDVRVGFAQIDGPLNVLAVTNFTYSNVSSGAQVFQPGITIRFDAGEAYVLSGGEEKVSGVTFTVIGLHEIGHALGLGHYDVAPYAVMNSQAHASVTNLTTSDIDGIQALYGVLAPVVVTPPPPAAAIVAPVSHGDFYITAKNAALSIPSLSGVLSNDTDPNGALLTAAMATNGTHGTATLNANGSFSYVPAVGFTGNDQFTYVTSDGQAQSTVATVNVTVGDIAALTTTSQIISELYVGYFNRAPDNAGLAYWAQNYDTPVSSSADGGAYYHSLSQAAASFADPRQTETTALYPFLADTTHAAMGDITGFVSTAYSNLFGHSVPSTDPGVLYWSKAIAKGLSIAAPTYGDPVIDQVGPTSVSNALIAIILGAQDKDAQTVANKVVAGTYYAASLIDNQVQFTLASAKNALVGITDQTASVLSAQTKINSYIATAPHALQGETMTVAEPYEMAVVDPLQPGVSIVGLATHELVTL